MNATHRFGFGGSGSRWGGLVVVALLGAASLTACGDSEGGDDDAGGAGDAGEGAGSGTSGSGGSSGSSSGGRGGSAGSSTNAGTGGEACVPRPCTATVCGVMQDDGCGALVECSCPECELTSCEAENKDCGEISDGCGGMLDCGECEGEESCGGSGEPNVCGCEPTSCDAEGRECGELSDGCGTMLDCGDCEGSCSCGSDGICRSDGEPDEPQQKYGQTAVSSGFPGTDAEYTELYSLPCFSKDDCVAPCVARDGTEEMCGAATCVESTPENYCLPATIWTRLGSLSAEGTDIYADCSELVLWNDPYRDFLRVTDFKFEIPETAEITGITVTVRRAGGGPDEAVDDGVHLIKGGEMGTADRSSPMPWGGPELANVDYGGATDLWNETWTPADVNDPDFGVALSAAYTQTAGNGRAYVDIVYATVHYRTACE